MLKLNDSELQGKHIKVRLAMQKTPRVQSAIQSNIIFVGNISHSSTEDTIGHHFSKFGSIKEVRIARAVDNTSREFCYVEFNDIESATKALENNGTLLDGKVIKVDLAEKLRSVVTSISRPYKWNLEI